MPRPSLRTGHIQRRAAGKTLVVSCGDVAASGGMFLAVRQVVPVYPCVSYLCLPYTLRKYFLVYT